MRKHFTPLDATIFALGLVILIVCILSAFLKLGLTPDITRWLCFIGAGFAALPYICVRFARIALRRRDIEVTFEEERQAQRVASYVAKKLEATDEHGTSYRNHSEAVSDANEKIIESIVINKASGVDFRLLAVAMRYSWEYLSKREPGGLRHLVETYPKIKFDVKIAIVRSSYLARFDLDLKEFDWVKFSKSLPEMLINLEKEWRMDGIRNISFEVFEYESIPHRHGFLINREYLFLGQVDWDATNTSGKPRMSVGANQYRYFDRSTDAGANRIALFRHWFAFYSRFDEFVRVK